MFKSGLTSITFRDLSCEKIVELAADSCLESIEWGSDVHILPGNYKKAQKILNLTLQAGIDVCSYGSYYYLDESKDIYDFEVVMNTALALQAPNIRIWAGAKGSAQCDNNYKKQFLKKVNNIADIAARNDIYLSFEYHCQTLFDCRQSAVNLLSEIDNPNVRTYWQPDIFLDHFQNLDDLEKMLPWLSNLHVFHWGPTYNDRHLLSSAVDIWEKYLRAANLKDDNIDHYALIEFVKDDSIENFKKDAASLNKMVKNTAAELISSNNRSKD